jgi:hypothetical protein
MRQSPCLPDQAMPRYFLAPFTSDVTPPLGHPLCGGWIEPVRGVDDPLKAIGTVILGPEKPILLCAVDWCGLRNDAYRQWRAALAEAAHTTPERVAMQCVHPHNAPFADIGAQKKIAAANAPISLDLAFFDRAVKGSADALRKALPNAVPFTHVGTGSAKVFEVASNRRVLGPDGKVKFTRTSATKNAEARQAAEGLIDPVLRTLSFWDGDTLRVAMHYYTTHPMSYYGDGRVSADFCGLARQKRQDENHRVHQIYFTGAAGNVTPGKYNDGEKANRIVLRDRIHRAMVNSSESTVRFPITKLDWRVESVKFSPRKDVSFTKKASEAVLNDPKATAAKRNNAAFQLAWLDRIETPIELTCLDFGDKAKLLHLPGEPFVEFQLAAQKMRPDSFVCLAGYGDGGPGYIPTERAFLEGGYEPTVALAAPQSEQLLLNAIGKLLDADPRKAKP